MVPTAQQIHVPSAPVVQRAFCQNHQPAKTAKTQHQSQAQGSGSRPTPCHTVYHTVQNLTGLQNSILKVQMIHQLGDDTLWERSIILQDATYTLSQGLLYGAILPIAKIHGSRNQWEDVGMILFTITPRYPAGELLQLQVLLILSPWSQKGIYPPNNTMRGSLNLKLLLISSHLRLTTTVIQLV